MKPARNLRLWMKKRRPNAAGTRVALTLGCLLVLNACNVARRLPPGEKLYVGADFKLQADESVSKARRKEIASGLAGLARPRPAKTLFGFPYKVWLYYLLKEEKKQNTTKRKFGEAPVLASARALTANETVFRAYLENEGYFKSSVSSRYVEKKGYQVRAEYTVQVPHRYEFDSVRILADSTPVGKALRLSARESLLDAGDPYRFEVIQAERQRISQFMKRQGYYYFQPDYVAVLADSAVGAHRVKPYLALKPDMPSAARLPYKIRDVYIYSNYSLGGGFADTSRSQARPVPTDTAMRRVFIVDSGRLYKPQLFRDVLSVRPGRRYNSRAQDLTLSRLINLNVFKFVRNRFEPIGDTTARQRDTAQLDVHYYLTPYLKKSARLEVAGLSKSNSLVGSQLTLSWRNRNTLRRAELLTINASTGVEWQVGARSQGVTNYRYGLDVGMSFPRLVVPFPIRYDRRRDLPKTNATVGYELIRRNQLYDLNSIQSTFGYAFRTSQQTEHTVTPLSVTYVKINNYGDRFFDILTSTEIDENVRNQYVNLLTADQFILSSLYSFTHNSPPQSRSPYAYRLAASFEPAGNLAGLLATARNSEGKKTLLGQAFSQYVRLDLDARQYWRLAPSLTWATRLFAGAGFSYGNFDQMPFVKQYFVGGSNSVRGFRPRAIGPGTVKRVGTGTPLIQDGGGDIKLEGNTEFRGILNKYIQGALFVDAGNVWMYQNAGFGAGAVFGSNFLRELAVSTGAGLRIDVQYFLLRFDLAFPVRKPYLPDNQRWVFNEINFRDSAWRRENLVLNIAVGYPF